MSYKKGSLDDYIKQEITQNWVKQYEEMLLKDEVYFFKQATYNHLIDHYDENLEYDKAYQLIESAIEQHPYTITFQIKKAQFLFEHYDAQEALDLLDQVRLFHPEDLEIFLLEAEIYLSCGQYRQAKNELYKALQVADLEEKIDIYLTLADVYEHWGRKEAAFRSIRQALVLMPNHEDALNRMEYFVEDNEKYSESIILHRQLIDQDPYSYLAWYNLGQAFTGLGLYEKAIESYEFSLVINEQFQAACISSGRAYYGLENYETALVNFQAALLIDESDEELYTYIGLCHFQLGQLSEAIQHFTAAIQINDTHHEAFYHMGKCYELTSNLNKSSSYYQRALYLSPYNLDYTFALGTIWQNSGHIDKTAILYQELLEQDPYNWLYWDILLQLMLVYDPASALQLIDNFYFVHHFQTIPSGMCLKAACLWANDSKQESLLLFEQALNLDPLCLNLVVSILTPCISSNELSCLLSYL